MRKILCVLVIIFFSLRLSAQFEKGNYITGGSFQANFISPANSSVHNYHIAFDPRVGYYFMNGFASGVDLTGGLIKPPTIHQMSLAADLLSDIIS